MPSESEIYRAVHGEPKSTTGGPRQLLVMDGRRQMAPITPRYPRGMLDQIDFRPIHSARRAPVVQAQPPPPRSGPSCPVCSVPGTARPGDGVRCPICQRRVS